MHERLRIARQTHENELRAARAAFDEGHISLHDYIRETDRIDYVYIRTLREARQDGNM